MSEMKLGSNNVLKFILGILLIWIFIFILTPLIKQNFAKTNFEEIENGWVIIFRGKKWMVNDLEELSQRVVAIMVEHKLEK